MFVTVSCAIPYMSFPGLNLSFTDTVFESVSGFTTTGGTVIEGLNKLPHSILFYRQQTEFFGYYCSISSNSAFTSCRWYAAI